MKIIQGNIITHRFDESIEPIELEVLKIVDEKALTWCDLYKEQWHEIRLLIFKRKSL